MKRTGNFASIALMLAVALSLAWLKWPQDRAEQREETVQKKQSPAQMSETEIRKELERALQEQAQMNTVTLPAPPPAPAMETNAAVVPDTAAKTPKPAEKPLKTRSVLKPEAQKPTPVRAVQPLKQAAPQDPPTTKKRKTIEPIKPRKRTKIVEVTRTPIQTFAPTRPETMRPVIEPIKPIKAELPQDNQEQPDPQDRPEKTHENYPTNDNADLVADARGQALSAAKELPAAKAELDDWRKQADQVLHVSASQSKSEVQAGRSLLRLLEHGSGPAIEIAWPSSNRERMALFDSFNACFGMVTAVMDRSGMLYREGGRSGKPWQVSMDAYSGFVRQPSGAVIQAEEKKAALIRRQHRLAGPSTMVRVFPRSVDAVILGGLSRLIGHRYKQARVIHARYQKSGRGLEIRSIMVDGTPVSGTISVEAYRHCGGLT
ncbi:hypothetical protein [Aestuariispira insulae]|uniref:Uncharacterized protein n=1 Tax=Aestuariispira insulae TaxID=1461337 RepID=A0A3D9HVY9_9PROT|nr:hypothetical protein [Aestuariispira insulae]RED53551.1 hypothetical protein DFP90_101342 [Aestuariispira insulae]